MSSTPVPSTGSSLATAGPSRPSNGPSPDPYPSSSSSSPPSHTSRFAAETFSSSLALAISLSLADLPRGSDTSLAAEYVYYTTARRNLYLPLILQEVKEALVGLICDARASSAIKDEDLWFEYRGVALKWHWPIGLLYDHTVNNLAPTHHTLATSSRSTPSRKRRDVSPSRSPALLPSPPPIPWHITLRLRDLPQIRLPNPTSNPTLPPSESPVARLVESSKQAYMGMLKEADFIRNGNTKKVNNLRRSEQDGIWNALVTGDYIQFTSLTSKILPAPSAYPAQMQPSAPPSSFPHTSFRTASHSTVASDPPADSAGSTVPRRASSLHAAPTGALPGGSHQNVSNPSLPVLERGGTNEDPGAATTAESTPSTSASGTTANEAGSRAVKGQGLPGIKAIPVRFILQGGTVLPEGVPPLTEDGKPMMLWQALHALFPALFPLTSLPPAGSAPTKSVPPPLPLVSGLPPSSDSNRPTSTYGVDFSPLAFTPSLTTPKLSSPSTSNSTADGLPSTTAWSAAEANAKGTSSSSSSSSSSSFGAPLAVPILHGVRLPLESPMVQLARSLSGADGWLTIVLLLLPEGDRAY